MLTWLQKQVEIYEKKLNKVNLNEYERDFYSGKL